MCVWSIAIQLNSLFNPSAGLDLFHDMLHCEFSGYACFGWVGSVFFLAITCFFRIAVWGGSVIASRVVGGMGHPVHGDGIVDSMLIHCDSIWRGRYYR